MPEGHEVGPVIGNSTAEYPLRHPDRTSRVLVVTINSSFTVSVNIWHDCSIGDAKKGGAAS